MDLALMGLVAAFGVSFLVLVVAVIHDRAWRNSPRCLEPGCPKRARLEGLCYQHSTEAAEACRLWEDYSR